MKPKFMWVWAPDCCCLTNTKTNKNRDTYFPCFRLRFQASHLGYVQLIFWTSDGWEIGWETKRQVTLFWKVPSIFVSGSEFVFSRRTQHPEPNADMIVVIGYIYCIIVPYDVSWFLLTLAQAELSRHRTETFSATSLTAYKLGFKLKKKLRINPVEC